MATFSYKKTTVSALTPEANAAGTRNLSIANAKAYWYGATKIWTYNSITDTLTATSIFYPSGVAYSIFNPVDGNLYGTGDNGFGQNLISVYSSVPAFIGNIDLTAINDPQGAALVHCTGMCLSQDGTKLYVGTNNSGVATNTLAIFNVPGLTYVTSKRFSAGTENVTLRPFAHDSVNHKVYAIPWNTTSDNGKIYQFDDSALTLLGKLSLNPLPTGATPHGDFDNISGKIYPYDNAGSNAITSYRVNSATFAQDISQTYAYNILPTTTTWNIGLDHNAGFAYFPCTRISDNVVGIMQVNFPSLTFNKFVASPTTGNNVLSPIVMDYANGVMYTITSNNFNMVVQTWNIDPAPSSSPSTGGGGIGTDAGGLKKPPTVFDWNRISGGY